MPWQIMRVFASLQQAKSLSGSHEAPLSTAQNGSRASKRWDLAIPQVDAEIAKMSQDRMMVRGRIDRSMEFDF
jgi:hypothetical protein